MDAKIVFSKLEKIEQSISEINVLLAEQGKDLKYHIKRSDQADSAINVLNERLSEEKSELVESIKPLQKHVNMVEGVMQFIGLIAVLAGIYQVFK